MKEYSKSLHLLISLVRDRLPIGNKPEHRVSRTRKTLEFSTNQRLWHDSSKL